MHLSFLHKYVIISITYLTPKPEWACLGSHSLRHCIREDGDGHRPETLPPTPFPDDASNQATFTPYMKITASMWVENEALQAEERDFRAPQLRQRTKTSPSTQRRCLGPHLPKQTRGCSLRPACSLTAHLSPACSFSACSRSHRASVPWRTVRHPWLRARGQ